MIINDYTRKEEVKGKEIFLDLHSTNLIGFHRSVDGKIIKSMVESIDSRKEFLPVYIASIEYNKYFMTSIFDSETGRIDGGHHRAYAHFIKGVSLRCIIIDSKYAARNCIVNIRDLAIK